MELQDELFVFRFGVSVKDIFIADSALVIDWHDVAMCMGSGLIEMHYEANDILLAELTCDKVVDILSPLLYLRLSLDILVATFRLEVHLLIAKCQLRHAVMGAAEDKLHGSTDIGVLTPDVRVFDAT